MPPTRIWQVITMLFMITTALSKPQMASAALPDDKLLHLGAGVALGAAGYGLAACLHEKSWVRASSGMALGALVGGTKEWLDARHGGESSGHDFLSTLAGTALSVGLLFIWDQLSPYKDEEKTKTGSLPSSPNRETALGLQPLNMLTRNATSHESALSTGISGHAFQTRSQIPFGVSSSSHDRTLHGPRRALLQ
ncbi:MAG: hypothetical protein HOK28_24990, partial [Deltaproteobacteria bacterium]|nr:hypothetical protein [Deltaproteobacteria bacterium]